MVVINCAIYNILLNIIWGKFNYLVMESMNIREIHKKHSIRKNSYSPLLRK